MADAVGELHREGLFLSGRLIFVVGFLLLRVVRGRFVGRLGHDERITGGIRHAGLVAGRDTGRIRSRRALGLQRTSAAADDQHEQDRLQIRIGARS